MNMHRAVFGVVSIALAVSGVAVLQARPASVATVGLSRALEGLDQFAERQGELSAMNELMKAENAEREKEIEDLGARMKEAAQRGDTAEAARLEEEVALKAMNLQATQKFWMNKTDIEHALVLQDLCQMVFQAAAELAQSEGYDLVLVDDSHLKLDWSNESQASREAQLLQKLSTRRVIYRSPAIDITDDLVVRMNNQFKAGNGQVKPVPPRP